MGLAYALEPLINASVQTADGFVHEYSKAALAYHFLCSVLTRSVGEAGSAASEPPGFVLLVYLLRCEQQTCNLHFFIKVRLNTTLFSNVTFLNVMIYFLFSLSEIKSKLKYFSFCNNAFPLKLTNEVKELTLTNNVKIK